MTHFILTRTITNNPHEDTLVRGTGTESDGYVHLLEMIHGVRVPPTHSRNFSGNLVHAVSLDTLFWTVVICGGDGRMVGDLLALRLTVSILYSIFSDNDAELTDQEYYRDFLRLQDARIGISFHFFSWPRNHPVNARRIEGLDRLLL